MDNKDTIKYLKDWLGTGSINVFGLPYSGKDTVGIRLAESLGGKFLSSGLILREAEKNDKELNAELSQGMLASQDKFLSIVLPYFLRADIAEFPLVLSSVGRWSGEEYNVMAAARDSGHEIKAVVLLNVSEADVKDRWDQAQIINDRGERTDDDSAEVLEKRIAEFREKTMPVLETYRDLGLLINVKADTPKDEVFSEVVKKLVEFASK